ncbi:MAG: T9SS type A sorting domain-containing protein [Flavobacteriales bacterium]|nr:T9SS type A sorting domain-containing protein [Flavobacteriales bacterium]
MKNIYQKFFATCISLAIITGVSAQNKTVNYWTKSVQPAASLLNKSASNLPSNSEFYELNITALRLALANAPLRNQVNTVSATIIDFPIANGKTEQFRILEAPVMHPDLAAKYPNIKSYVGKGIDDPSAMIRFSLSDEKGLSSMILSGTKNSMFIEPYTTNLATYAVYTRSSSENRNHIFNCLTDDVPYEFKKSPNANKDADGQSLRTFRLAMSATGEYTTWHGGTKAQALAAMNTTMTRVNGVYEVDFAITMVLIANNDDVIYTNSGSDPYTGSLNAQLQSTLTSVIGEANYDVGHLVHQAGNNGNAGCIGCICVDGSKGSGYTSHSTPQGDDFDIDFVAHEMGHQFGGNHTHTHGANEGSGAQMEPGSGSTIMGYAGITGASDVQPHSDDYFHYFNIKQITNYIGTTSCQTSTALTNATPTANAGSNYTIPRGTAFILEGSGTDADAGDVLTYCWEQGDVGFTASTSVSATNTSGPNFRSIVPTTSPNRYMPKLTDVIAGNLTTQWETVSDVARTMNFALTVRDNAPGVGQNKIDLMQVTVNGSSGPFTVTSQTTAVSWDEGASKQITWNVANTTAAPVSAANVDIFLSLDGGLTYPLTLATNVPNNGTATITVPTASTTSTARVMVRGSGNIFYALNTTNFSITASEFVLNFLPAATANSLCAPGSATYNFTYNTFLGFSQVTTFSATGLPAGTTVSFNPATATADGTPVIMTINGITIGAVGNYAITVTGTAPSPLIVKNAAITLDVFSSALTATTLTSPTNGALSVLGPIVFTWIADPNASAYDIDIATDAAFTAIVDNATGLITNSYTSSSLASNTIHYWRVRPSNMCGNGSFSTSFDFTTSNCNNYVSTDVSVNISSSGTPTITSTINITTSGIINDLDVTNLTGTHSWINDLIVTLTSPQGTSVILWDQICFNENDFNVNFDDGATPGALPCPPIGGGTYQPQGSLANYNGEDVLGIWTLTIDDMANQDGGSLDSWELDICFNTTVTGVNENVVSNDISIYPNPNIGLFTLNTTGSKNVTVKVMNTQGQIIFSKNNINVIEQIDLSNSAKGIYFVTVTSDKGVTTQKITIQ